MNRWRHVSECTASPHLPPAETCVLLEQDKRGNTRAIEQWETPVDDNGIPNPYETLRLLASTLDASYMLPIQTNVHHQVHYRSEYSSLIEKEYRESPSLMMNMSVQMHNLNHKLLLRAPKPPVNVMEQYNAEQRALSLLFRLGSASLASDRAATNSIETLGSLSRTELRVATDAIADYRRRARMKRRLYEKHLGRATIGRLGLLPEVDDLRDMGMSDATAYLGKIGGNQFLDFRRASQEFIARYGVKTTVIAAREGEFLTDINMAA
jgi:hypothetical protein